MKFPRSFVVSSILCAASASNVGHVYIYDPVTSASPQPRSTVTPETARLILAQRLGLSRFHSIQHADDKAIRQLNTYGGTQQKLFGGEDRQRTKAHVLVWVEHINDVAAITKDLPASLSEFTVPNPPSASDNDQLIKNLILQAEALPKKADPRQTTYTTGIDAEALLKPTKHVEIYNDYLSILHASKVDELDLTTLSSTLAKLIGKSIADKDEGFPITIVLMPPSSPLSKRSAHPYGSYDLPPTFQARREPTEALLAPSSSPSSTPNIVPDLESFPTIQQVNDTSPVLGILSACFESMDICQRTTHNCSSHGKCKLLHKGGTGKDALVEDCYGCACETEVKIISGGGMEEKRKVTYWGGPACQKKDISVPFFLFVSIGLILAFLISASIGMMFTMGNEELPSVIGAGVSGPVRK